MRNDGTIRPASNENPAKLIGIFQNVAVGRINSMAALMGFSLGGTKRGVGITR